MNENNATFDEGTEDWTAAPAMGAPSQGAPGMQMQSQDNDAFGEDAFASVSNPVVTI